MSENKCHSEQSEESASSGKRDVSTTPQLDSNVILNECEESISALKFVVLLCFFQKCAMIFWESILEAI